MSYCTKGFGCCAIEVVTTKKICHVVHVHLCEILHVPSEVVPLHLGRQAVQVVVVTKKKLITKTASI